MSKRVRSLAEALAGIRDGSTILVGGFGAVGEPNVLVEGLIEQGARDLVIVNNNAGVGHVGIARLMSAGRVRRLVCSYARSRGSVVFEPLARAGRVELELVPQGTLAERIRAAAHDIPAFYTPVGTGTALTHGRECRDLGGRTHVLEPALRGDAALIEAWEADAAGNLRYRASGRNFNAVMARAASLTVVQAHRFRAHGTLEPDAIVTDGRHVDRVFVLPASPEEPIHAG